MAMAYSLHVGSDKNRKLSSKGITTKEQLLLQIMEYKIKHN